MELQNSAKKKNDLKAEKMLEIIRAVWADIAITTALMIQEKINKISPEAVEVPRLVTTVKMQTMRKFGKELLELMERPQPLLHLLQPSEAEEMVVMAAVAEEAAVAITT